MSDIFNVYCDESCHLEHDHQTAMVLGAVWCPLEKSREIAVRLREIKQKNGLNRDFEVKWTKISPAKAVFYIDLIDYFFDDDFGDNHFGSTADRILFITTPITIAKTIMTSPHPITVNRRSNIFIVVFILLPSCFVLNEI